MKAILNYGSAIQESIVERSAISATVSNANQMLKYYKGALKSGIYTLEQIKQSQLIKYYNELLSTEHLAIKYSELWSEKYYKVKLSIEKLLTQPNGASL